MYGFLANLINKPTPSVIDELVGGYMKTAGGINQLHQQKLMNAMREQQLQEQPDLFNSQQALRDAQTKSVLERLKLLPQDQAFKERSLDLREKMMGGLSYRNKPSYPLLQYISHLPESQRQAFFANNPGAMAQFGQALLKAAVNPNAANQVSALPVAGNETPMAPQKQDDEQSFVQPILQSTPKIDEELNPTQGLSQADMIKLTGQLGANKATSDPSIRKRFESGLLLEKFFDDPRINKVMQNAAQYAGAFGKGKAALDSFNSKNPEAYEDYLEFKNSMASNFNNMIRQMEGLSVTPSQREELTNMLMSSMNQFNSNPARAMDQFLRLRKELRNITKGLSGLAQKAYPGVLEKRYGIDLNRPIMGFNSSDRSQNSSQAINFNGTNEELLAMAKKRGIL